MFADAEAYEKFMGRWSRLLAPGFVDFSHVPERGRMLDVGTGTGTLAFTIAERNVHAHVVGIDPSQEYIAYAAGRNPYGGRAGFEVGDAQRLRFPDAGFHGALSLLVFNFIPDPKKALYELRRVVKPLGIISAAVWDYGGGMRMLRTFWDAAIELDPQAERLDEKHMPLCRAGELPALWRECGMEDIREQPIDIEMRFTSFADFWDPFLLGQGPAGSYARGLTGERLHALRNELKSRMPFSGENEPFVLTARAWAVRGSSPKTR